MKKFLLSILCLVAVALTGYATEAKIVFSDLNYENGQELPSITVDENITLTFDKGTNNNTPKYYTSGTAARLYGGNTMTITAINGCTIESVVMNTGSSNKFHAESSVTNGTLTVDGTVGTISGVSSNTTTITQGGTSGHVRITDMTITYTEGVASSVATPTFSVEAGTYGAKQSVELACESEGAVIYYTLDGTTPDNTSTLYEAAIELNTKTTVKAIAYVGEEASKVASASYDFKLDCVLTWNENSPFIQASTMMPKTNFVSPLGSSGANYYVTFDGSEPSADNPNASTKYPSCSVSMYLIKKDTIFTMKVRAEKDGIYGETLEGTFYFAYASTLTAYKGINTMAAGNYVMTVDGIIARRLDGDYGYLPAVAATAANGGASAFSYFEWTFEATEGGYYIKDSQGKYLYMNGSYNSFNVSDEVPTSAGVWTVEFNADGTAKITNVEKNKYIQYSSKYSSWGCYPDEQGIMPVLGGVFTPVVTMTPESGATLESISKITFTCPDGIKAGKKYNYCSVQGTSSTSAVISTNQVDDNTVEFILESEVTSSGEYNFILYKEALIVAPNSIAQVYPAATEYHTYTVKSSAPEVQLVVTPENESTQKSLQNFTFSYSTGIYPNELFGGQAPFLGYTDPATGASSQIALTITAGTETSVTLSTEKEQTAEGYYTLVVPAEYFVLGGSKPNEAIMNQYMVSATNPNAVNILSVTPEEGTVTELSKITVVTDTDLEVAPSNWTITDANGTSYEFKVTNNDNDKNGSYEALNIVLNETITAEGTYTLNIPAGSVKEYMGNKAIEAHTITWTIEAGATEPSYIEFLSVNPAEGTVASLKEIQIISDTDLVQAEGLKLTDANGTEYALSSGTNDRVDEDGIYESVIVTIKDEITAAGTYTLTIPAGAVVEYITDMNITPKVNAEKTYTWTIEAGATEPDYIFNANDYEVDAEYATLTDGIFTFLQGEGSTKPWIFDANSKKFSNGHEATLRIKPQTDKNYITADVPATGKLVFGVLSSSSSATDRTLSVKQNDVELYGKVVSEADKVDGVYNVHEVNVEAGLATITMAGAMNFYYIEFVPGGEQEEGIDANFTADPKNNSTVSEIREITLTFTDYKSVTVAEPDLSMGTNIPSASMIDPEFGFANPVGYVMFRAGKVENQLVLYVDPEYAGVDAFTVEGDYTINVPKGVVTFSDGINKAFTLNYTVKAGVVESTEVKFLSVNPEEGKVESLSFIQIITDTDLGSVGGCKLTDANGKEYEIEQYPENKDESDPNWESIIIVPSEEITAAGTYTLTVPAGAAVEFIQDATLTPKTNAAATYTWTIEGEPVEEGLYITEVDPAEGSKIVEKFESVITTWSMDCDLSYTGVECWIEDAAGTKITSVAATYVYDDNHVCIDNKLEFVLSTPIEEANGVYTLVIGAGYVADMATYSVTNEEIRISYDLDINSGIAGIKVDAENGYVVYDLNGYRVMQTRNAADLDRLENGIYIINGVKVLLNK
ncbi:MAG: chitobiase/beta-hexosaminidase C-terminal domain-containing protein [Bacteroidaceae bacterium]|nr:chitobiase/beta-hexosaminidase C-terminal domain-containing protein [Bacteroidaceae bacterium]